MKTEKKKKKKEKSKTKVNKNKRKLQEILEAAREHEQRDEADSSAAAGAAVPAAAAKISTTTIHLSGGFPEGCSLDDVVSFARRCGLVQMTRSGQAFAASLGSGEYVVRFARRDSVALALKVLDGAFFSASSRAPAVRVRAATAEEHRRTRPAPDAEAIPAGAGSEYDPLSWSEANQVRIIVIRGMYTLEEAAQDPGIYAELTEEVREEAEARGAVRLVRVFKGHPEGVVVVKFRDPLDAERARQAFDGRWFAGRRLRAEFYDGREDLAVHERELRAKGHQETEENIDAFADWLENDDVGDDEDF